MERRSSNLREEFDPSCNFFTVKALTVNGRVLGPGQPFPRGIVEPRRLRQLYDARFIRQEEAPLAHRLEEAALAHCEVEREKPAIEIGRADKIKAARKRARAA